MFNTKKILVVGDIMLDSYYIGEVQRISPEAPVPVLLKKSEKQVLGGGANVAVNLKAANQEVKIISVIGKDFAGRQIKKIMEEMDFDISSIIEDKNIKTTEKIRMIGNADQQLLRVDVEEIALMQEDLEEKLILEVKKYITRTDIVVLSDYCKGVLSSSSTHKIIKIANKYKKQVLVDVKDKNINKYKGAFLIKPNLKELQELSGRAVRTQEEIIETSKFLIKKVDVDNVLVTQGSEGMTLVSENEYKHYKASKVEVFDVTGAGDTSISYLAAALANGWSLDAAIIVSNIAAGIQVSKRGTSSVYEKEVEEKWDDNAKTIYFENADSLREHYKNKKIVFTNGFFDILHRGHVDYLKKAKMLGDILVVGLNSDESVKKLKGNDRPINTQSDRMEILKAMKCIDYVIIFEQDTPYELIEKIQPDILVKGGDYMPDAVVGKDIVERRGGMVKILPFLAEKSTTNIISKIKNRNVE